MWHRCEFGRLHTQSQAMLMTKGCQPRACPFKPCVMKESGWTGLSRTCSTSWTPGQTWRKAEVTKACSPHEGTSGEQYGSPICLCPHGDQPKTTGETPHDLLKNYFLSLQLFRSLPSCSSDGGRGFLKAEVRSFAFRYISSGAVSVDQLTPSIILLHNQSPLRGR